MALGQPLVMWCWVWLARRQAPVWVDAWAMDMMGQGGCCKLRWRAGAPVLWASGMYVGREGQGVTTYLVHVQAAECYVGGRLRAVGRVGKGLLRGGGGMGLGGLPGWASGLSRLDGAGRGVLGMEAAKQVQLGPGCL